MVIDMRTALLRYGLSIAFSTVLALGTAATCEGSVRTAAYAESQVSQYCAPPEQDNSTFFRLYCNDREG